MYTLFKYIGNKTNRHTPVYAVFKDATPLKTGFRGYTGIVVMVQRCSGKIEKCPYTMFTHHIYDSDYSIIDSNPNLDILLTRNFIEFL